MRVCWQWLMSAVCLVQPLAGPVGHRPECAASAVHCPPAETAEEQHCHHAVDPTGSKEAGLDPAVVDRSWLDWTVDCECRLAAIPATVVAFPGLPAVSALATPADAGSAVTGGSRTTLETGNLPSSVPALTLRAQSAVWLL